MEAKIDENGVVKTSFSTISRKCVSVQSVGSKKIEVFEFVNTYIPGPSGTAEDYRVVRKPKKVDEYDIEKAVHERCKGQDLKSIIARVNQSGDPGILMQRNAVYGDTRKLPANYGEALNLGAESSKVIESIPVEQRALYMKLAQDPKAFDAFIEKRVAEIMAKKQVGSPAPKVEEKGDGK